MVLAGDLAVVGARTQGAVYVYRRDGQGSWSAAGELTSPGASSEFGAALAADGERILVGAPGIDRAYVFEDDGDDDWPVAAELAGGAGDGTWPFITHKNSRQPANGEGFGNAIAASTTMLTVLENGLSSRPSEQSVFTAPPAPGG